MKSLKTYLPMKKVIIMLMWEKIKLNKYIAKKPSIYTFRMSDLNGELTVDTKDLREGIAAEDHQNHSWES